MKSRRISAHIQKPRRWFLSLTRGEKIQVTIVLATIIPGLIAGMIAWLTLREMQAERDSAMRPDVVLEADPVLYYYEQTVNEDGEFSPEPTGFDWTETLEGIGKSNKCDSIEERPEFLWQIDKPADEHKGFMPFRAVNIGLGTAKDIRIDIDRSGLDAVYEELSADFFSPYFLAKLEGEWADEAYADIPDDYYSVAFEYLQTSGSGTGAIFRPFGLDGLDEISSFLFRVDERDECKSAFEDRVLSMSPNRKLFHHRGFTLVVSFADMQGVRYAKRYSLDVAYSFAIEREEGANDLGVLTCFRYEIEEE